MTADQAIANRTIPPATTLEPVWFLEMELTTACQLKCRHCYNNSSPAGSHGTMTRHHWEQVIDDAPAAGIRRVQFIGGEPTMHPHFLPLADHVLRSGLELQVFSNLYHVTPALWELYVKPRVTLATSYYSDVPELHDRVTGRPGSHRRTRAAIVTALERGIPLKVAIVETFEVQRAHEAHAEMAGLGVTKLPVVERMRGIGRAAEDKPLGGDVKELCGRCGDGRAAISPNGDVTMCVMARFLPPAGNVRDTPLGEILYGPAWNALLPLVPRPSSEPPCKPVETCPPASDGDDCPPASTYSDPEDRLVLPVIPAARTRTVGGDQ